MSHVTRMNESCHTYEWVMPHIRMSHVTLMNESCHTYEWVMSHVWMSCVTHMNESCHTYKWVMSHIWMSYRTYERVISHIWISHVTRMNESCHPWMNHVIYMNKSPIYEWVVPQIWSFRVYCHVRVRVFECLCASVSSHRKFREERT